MFRFSDQSEWSKGFRRITRSVINWIDLRNYGSIIIIGLWIITILCGFFGYRSALDSIGDSKTLTDTFYMTMQLFFTNYKLLVPPPNIFLQMARFLAPALMFSTIVFFLADNVSKSYKIFMIRISNHHIIICGLGLLGPVLVDQFCKKGYRVIVIEKDPRLEQIDQCKSCGAFVLSGDASDKRVLKTAGIERADCLISVTGEDEMNAEIAGCAGTFHRKNPNHTLNCYLHIVDLNLYNLLKATEFQKDHAPAFRQDLFNIYQTAGNAIIDRPSQFLDETQDPAEIRLLVIGIGRLGESLILHAAKRWITQFKKTGKRLSIMVVDKDAQKKRNLLRLRYPAIEKYCDVQVMTLDITSSEFNSGELLKPLPGEKPFSRIYLCLGNPALGLTAGLTIHNRLQELNIRNKGKEIPVIIRTNHETGLSHYLEALKDGGRVFSNMYAFSLREETSTVEKILNTSHELIAQAIHNDYLEQERLIGHTSVTSPNMVPWDNLSPDIQESNRLQADHIVEKLKEISCGVVPLIDWDEPLFGFSSDELEKLAEMEHERWMDEKELKGWKYAPKRDDKNKRHDALISYSELSEEYKEKDRNAVRQIPVLLKSVDLKIKRLN